MVILNPFLDYQNSIRIFFTLTSSKNGLVINMYILTCRIQIRCSFPSADSGKTPIIKKNLNFHDYRGVNFGAGRPKTVYLYYNPSFNHQRTYVSKHPTLWHRYIGRTVQCSSPNSAFFFNSECGGNIFAPPSGMRHLDLSSSACITVFHFKSLLSLLFLPSTGSP